MLYPTYYGEWFSYNLYSIEYGKKLFLTGFKWKILLNLKFKKGVKFKFKFTYIAHKFIKSVENKMSPPEYIY